MTIVGFCDINSSQKIGVYLVLWMRLAGVGARCHTGQPQHSHKPLNPFPVDLVTLVTQIVHDFTAAIKWMSGVLLINQLKQR
jgi:hypothetical protein